jgi:hypothetical protein
MERSLRTTSLGEDTTQGSLLTTCPQNNLPHCPYIQVPTPSKSRNPQTTQMSGFEHRKPNTFIHTKGDQRITGGDLNEVREGDPQHAAYSLGVCRTESESRATVEKEGYSYFIVDTDYQKGDRRCDGKFMADFFSVTDVHDSSVNYCRQSQRVHKRYIAETLRIENAGVAAYKASLESATAH